MPKVPSQSGLVSLDISGSSGNVNGAGIVGKAAADLGQTVADVGFDIAKQVKMAEANDAVFRAQNKNAEDLRLLRSELESNSSNGYIVGGDQKPVQNADGSFRTISQEFGERADTLFRQSQDDMPNRFAQEDYVSRQGSYFRSAIQQSFNDEEISKVKYFKENTVTQINDSAKDLFTSPDLNMFNTKFRILESHVGTSSGPKGFMSYDEGKEILNHGGSELAEKYFQGEIYGLTATKKTPGLKIDRVESIKRVKDILDNKGPEVASIRKNGGVAPADKLTADQKVQLTKQLLQAQDTVEKLDVGEANAALEGIKGSFDLGVGGKNEYLQSLDIIHTVQQSGSWKANEAQTKIYDVASTYVLSSIKNSVDYKNATIAERQKMIESAPSQIISVAKQSGISGLSTSGLQSVVNVKEKTKNYTDESIEAEKKNSADFQASIQNSPQYFVKYNWNPIDPKSDEAMTPYLKESFARNKDGVQKRFTDWEQYYAPIGKEQAEQISNFFTNPRSDVDQIAARLQSLNKFEDQPFMIEQMIRDKQLSPDWRLVNYLTDHMGQTTLLTALRVDKKDEGSLVADLRAKDPSLTDQKIEDDINALVGDFAMGMSLENPGSKYTDEIQESFKHVAKVHALQLARKHDWDTAKDLTRKKMVDDLVTFVPLEQDYKGINYNFMAPKSIIKEDNVKTFSANIEKLKIGSNLKALGVEPPPQKDLSTGELRASPYDKQFHDRVGNRAIVVKESSYKGAAIYYEEDDGSVSRAFTKEDGKIVPLVIPWSKLKDEDFLNDVKVDQPTNKRRDARKSF